jgi:hypothetical protein
VTAAALRRCTLAVTGALLLACTACGGSDKPAASSGGSASDSPSASSTPSPSPTESSGPAQPTKPSVPTPTNNKAGRIAFAEYVLHAFEYGFGTNDATPITSVALKTGKLHCASCDAWARYLKRQKSKNQTRQPWALPIKSSVDQGQVQPGLNVVDLLVRRPALADVDTAGTRHRPQKAQPNYLYEIGMTWQDGRWQMTGWLEKDK